MTSTVASPLHHPGSPQKKSRCRHLTKSLGKERCVFSKKKSVCSIELTWSFLMRGPPLQPSHPSFHRSHLMRQWPAVIVILLNSSIIKKHAKSCQNYGRHINIITKNLGKVSFSGPKGLTFKRSLMFIKHFWGHSQTLGNVCKSVDFGQEVLPL